MHRPATQPGSLLFAAPRPGRPRDPANPDSVGVAVVVGVRVQQTPTALAADSRPYPAAFQRRRGRRDGAAGPSPAALRLYAAAPAATPLLPPPPTSRHPAPLRRTPPSNRLPIPPLLPPDHGEGEGEGEREGGGEREGEGEGEEEGEREGEGERERGHGV